MTEEALGKPTASFDDYQLFWDLHEVRVSYRMHYGNYRELIRYLRAFRSMDSWKPENRIQLFDSIIDVHRCLQNFLSSAAALVAHTDRHVKRFYRRTEYQRDLESEMRAIKGTAIHQLVNELRNYSLHEAVSNVWASLTASPKGPEGSVTLRVEDLLKSNRWTGNAKTYLEEAGERLDIGRVVEEHTTLLNDFHKRLRERESRIHSDLLARLGKRIEELPEELLEK